MTRTQLLNIIKEELRSTLLERQESIVDKIKLQVPPILKNKVATQLYKVAKKGVYDKKISLNDLFALTSGLSTAVKTGKIEHAENAIKLNSGLKKLGLDVVLGDITQKVDDLGAAGRSPIGYDDRLTGGEQGFGKTYGAQLTARF
tara:strand:- start:103 stop:537 length:435 start_codon:yes stop_codon:yes gene_type:complete